MSRDPRLDVVLGRFAQGCASDDDVDWSAATLKKHPLHENRYELMTIIGETRARRHRAVLERYLEIEADPFAVRVALDILCIAWGEPHRYLESIRRWACGDIHDEEDWARLIALSCAGLFLAKNKDSELLEVVIDTYVGATERPLVREAAYEALNIAIGRDLREVVKAVSDSNFDPTVLRAARARLDKERAASAST